MHSHRLLIGSAAAVIALLYVLLAVTVGGPIAKAVGVGYISVLVTVSVLWDALNGNGRNGGHR